jgi:hypothetical protein
MYRSHPYPEDISSFHKSMLGSLPQVPSIHRVPARLFREQRHAADGARVCSKALYTHHAVRRAVRILAAWPGTASGTVTSCDIQQRAAAKASQREQDERDTRCEYSSSGPGSPYVEVSLFGLGRP